MREAERLTASSDDARYARRSAGAGLTLLLTALALVALVGALSAVIAWKDGSPGVGLPISVCAALLGTLIGVTASRGAVSGATRRFRRICLGVNAAVAIGWLVAVVLIFFSPH